MIAGLVFPLSHAEYSSCRQNQQRPQAMYELTAQFASLEPPPPELQQVLSAVARSQAAMDEFARVIAGATPPDEFFSDENVGRMLAAA